MTLSLVLLLLQAAPPQKVAFEAAVQRALAANPAMAVAAADAARAEALVEQARAPSLPSLLLNATYTRLEGDRVLASTGAVVGAANQLSANAQLQVPLIAPNRWANWRRQSAASAAVKAGTFDVRRLVALLAARSWLSVLAQQRVVQAQQHGVDAATAHLQYAKDRRLGGLGSKLDELRASQELQVAKSQLSSAWAQLERLQEQLGVAVASDVPLDALDQEPTLRASVDEAKALEAAKEQRDDVKAAAERVNAAKTATSWGFADYTPIVTAVVQPGYQNPPTISTPLFNFQAQILFTLPLYDGGLRYGQERERRAALKVAEAQLEAAARQASADVRAALKQMVRADEALVAARGAAQDAEAAQQLAVEAFRAGGSTNIEVIDAERRARDAATAQALAEDTARQARLEVLGASGTFP